MSDAYVAGFREAMDEILGDDDSCPHCGGDGYIMAADGDGSDWGEDTYCGPMDAVIKCRHCNIPLTLPAGGL